MYMCVYIYMYTHMHVYTYTFYWGFFQLEINYPRILNCSWLITSHLQSCSRAGNQAQAL